MSDDQVVLCRVTGEIHAKLLLDALASQGIAARAQPGWPFEGLGDLFRPPPPLGSAALARYRVYVRRRDLARARQVYDDFEVTGVEFDEAEAQRPDPDERAGG